MSHFYLFLFQPVSLHISARARTPTHTPHMAQRNKSLLLLVEITESTANVFHWQAHRAFTHEPSPFASPYINSIQFEANSIDLHDFMRVMTVYSYTVGWEFTWYLLLLVLPSNMGMLMMMMIIITALRGGYTNRKLQKGYRNMHHNNIENAVATKTTNGNVMIADRNE